MGWGHEGGDPVMAAASLCEETRRASFLLHTAEERPSERRVPGACPQARGLAGNRISQHPEPGRPAPRAVGNKRWLSKPRRPRYSVMQPG